MRENFDKFKKIELRKAVATGAAFGICCGLAAAGIFLLAFKLGAVELGWYIYAIIGACTALVSGTALFFVLTTSVNRESVKAALPKFGFSYAAKNKLKYRLLDLAVTAAILAMCITALVYYSSSFNAVTSSARAVRETYIIVFASLTEFSAAFFVLELVRVCAVIVSCHKKREKKAKSPVNAYDVRLAKKLDKEYNLGEKAQTLIEFQGQDSAMLALQREDAEAAIGAIRRKKPSAKVIIQSCAIAVISLALFISGVAVKQRVAEVVIPVDEQPFEMTDTQLIILNSTISNVESDNSMDSALKEKCTSALNDLKTYLTGGSATNGGMATEVMATMIEISTYTFETNTYDDFITAFNEAEGGTVFAWAVYDCAVCYKSTTNINSYDTVVSKSKTLDDDISDIMQEYIDGIIEVTDATEFATNLETTINTYKQTLDDAVSLTSDLPEDDGLYTAIETLRAEFLKYANRINGGYTIEAFHTGLASALNTFSRNSSTALRAQVYNCMMDEYMRQALSDIFGVAVQGLENPAPLDEDSGTGDEGGATSGGAGSGDTLYGSDDMVYDPNTGEYVQYGELLNAETNGYLSRLYAMLDSDDISDDVKSYIQAYINNLLGTGGGN